MTRDLVFHAHLDVIPFVSHDAFGTKLLPKLSRQLRVAGEKPRLQHGGFRAHVTVGLHDGFLDRTRRVSNLESAVPQQVQDLVHHLLQVRRNFRALAMQEHHVNIAKRVEFAPAISSKSYQRQRRTGLAISASSSG